MREPWRLPPECTVQSDMLWQRRQPFLRRSVAPLAGAVGRLASPRSTWEMAISWSSTTEAKWYVGNPSDLMITKSSSGLSRGKCISPKTRSRGRSSTDGGYCHRVSACLMVHSRETCLESEDVLLARFDPASDLFSGQMPTPPVVAVFRAAFRHVHLDSVQLVRRAEAFVRKVTLRTSARTKNGRKAQRVTAPSWSFRTDLAEMLGVVVIQVTPF